MILTATVVFLISLYCKNWLWLLPGTIAHEGLHYTVGWLTSAGPNNFTVKPNNSVYGEVWFTDLNQLNAFPTAVAPLLGIPLALMLIMMSSPKDQILVVIYGWIAGTVVAQAWPSEQDWRLVREYWIGSLFWILAIFWLTYRYIDAIMHLH